jgi:hypothetical protein
MRFVSLFRFVLYPPCVELRDLSQFVDTCAALHDALHGLSLFVDTCATLHGLSLFVDT